MLTPGAAGFLKAFKDVFRGTVHRCCGRVKKEVLRITQHSILDPAGVGGKGIRQADRQLWATPSFNPWGRGQGMETYRTPKAAREGDRFLPEGVTPAHQVFLGATCGSHSPQLS